MSMREMPDGRPSDGRGIDKLMVTVVTGFTPSKSQPALVTVCLLGAEQELLAKGFQNTYLDKSGDEET